MTIDVEGKTVVVTGASRGIGLGVARWCCRQGMNVAACARSPIPDLGPKVLAATADVLDHEALGAFADKTVARFGRIDLWINNAGILGPVLSAHDMSPADFQRVLAINVGGVFNGTQVYLRHARRRGQGVLINISSGAAGRAYAGWSAYSASKAAVDRFSEAVQLEEAAHGIRVHSVAPGVVDTAMQIAIRGTSKADFPMLSRFLKLSEDRAFNRPAHVAQELLAMAFDPARQPATVVCRVRPDPTTG